uniref:Uncharacterized protein n=1 Tax=Aegilops tauschii subsp. strangulata TaxID=200361 RepID=A0A453L2B2_AEGTS
KWTESSRSSTGRSPLHPPFPSASAVARAGAGAPPAAVAIPLLPCPWPPPPQFRTLFRSAGAAAPCSSRRCSGHPGAGAAAPLCSGDARSSPLFLQILEHIRNHPLLRSSPPACRNLALPVLGFSSLKTKQVHLRDVNLGPREGCGN